MFPLSRDGDVADDDDGFDDVAVDSGCVKDEREELKSEQESIVVLELLVQLVVAVDDVIIDEKDAFHSRLVTMSGAAESGINSSKSIRHEDVIISSSFSSSSS